MKHYFEVKILTKGPSSLKIIESIFSSFHGAMSTYEKGHIPIAISFPKIRLHSKQSLTHFGDVIRFFGSPLHLTLWFNNYVFEKLEDKGIIAVKGISAIPENPLCYVYYLRERMSDHAKKRGYDLTKSLSYPYVLLNSNSNKNKYPIRVKIKEATEKTNIDGQINVYGLSLADNPVPIPLF